MEILQYEAPPLCCEPAHAETGAAARVMTRYLQEHLSGVKVEHFGSTAVPGCAGKGIIDLLVLYSQGELESVREQIDGLGFQRQSSREPFPEERPMRVGAFEHERRRYLVHVHVVAADAPEVDDARFFRDCLRADPELRSAYVALKKEILASGIVDSTDYAHAKGKFIQQCLGKTDSGD
jgi:GrpB-like predicted nucleotidyltransferase (UPF0157 family)